MRKIVEIENIEEMRRREGINDVELRQAIRGLRVGDLVKLTLLTADKSFAGETLLVQITDIEASAFRGKLIEKPISRPLATLRAGCAVLFSAAHIHSLPKKEMTEVQ
jgi:hypothetical protein